MTHDHGRDLELTAALLHKPLRYLGLIGSQTKWGRFQQRLSNLGFAAHDIEKITCPIGLPIGGKAPKEVAISLASELVQLNYERVECDDEIHSLPHQTEAVLN